MNINKLTIQSFGKLNNRSFELSDGFNVVYGDNESGKTTIVSFIKYMLFGFHGRRSESNLIPEEKYSPWDNTAISGSMDFTYCGHDYITARSNGVRREYSTLNNTLGAKSFDGINPGEEIFGIDEAAFCRTYCLSAASGVFSAAKNDDIIIRLSNLKSSGDETVSYEKVNARLMSDKKKTLEEIRRKGDEIMELRRTLERIRAWDERLKTLSSQLYDTDSDIAGMRRTLSDTDKKNEQYEQLNESYSSLRLYQILKAVIFVLLMVLTCVLLFSSAFEPIFAVVTGAAAVVDILFMIPSRIRMARIERALAKSDMDAPIYSEDVKSHIERTESRKNDILKEMGAIESKLEQEYDYDDVCSNIDLLTEEKHELEKKLEVIEKAKSILDISYEELKNIFVPELNKRASEIFSALSGYKYNDVIVTDTFEILVKNEERYRSSKYFSTAILELMYFSLRLALCELIGGDEKLPVFLDDCFTSLDDRRVCTALEFLTEYAKDGRQIVFFTCHGREFRYLSGIDSVNIITV
ncbi:MAG: AAA family ATPase [Clostridia bacterium]|nr:AAA family ATPase [Clostridia bacterium]